MFSSAKVSKANFCSLKHTSPRSEQLAIFSEVGARFFCFDYFSSYFLSSCNIKIFYITFSVVVLQSTSGWVTSWIFKVLVS
uniref:Uncharacterized protein n=1 Tax=Pyxicephalus adspersus TaxID=30357 RepID=A0AAV3A413_PYXAD|nr:TPA: hypothetical protein GDO54_017843 [Pyxicephalus adspersus]